MPQPAHEGEARPAAFSIRAATTHDAHAIAEVHVRSWQAAYRGIVPDAYLDALTVEARTERWRPILARHVASERNWVAEAGGRVLGFASTGPSRDEDRRSNLSMAGELFAIYLAPEAFGGDPEAGAVGWPLFVHAWRDLARTFSPLTLWTLEENTRARRFYERAGWALDSTAAGRRSWELAGGALIEVRYVALAEPPPEA